MVRHGPTVGRYHAWLLAGWVLMGLGALFAIAVFTMVQVE